MPLPADFDGAAWLDEMDRQAKEIDAVRSIIFAIFYPEHVDHGTNPEGHFIGFGGPTGNVFHSESNLCRCGAHLDITPEMVEEVRRRQPCL